MLFDPYALTSSATGEGLSGRIEMVPVQGPTPHSAINEPVNASQCFDGLDANQVIQKKKYTGASSLTSVSTWRRHTRRTEMVSTKIRENKWKSYSEV